MTTNFAAGPATADLWDEVRPIIDRIEALPFLGQLADGSLDPVAFTNYITQDSIYLTGYAKAMSFLAARADDRSQSRFWASSAAEAITVEEVMHEELLADSRLATARQTLLGDAVEAVPSPTTLGYVSFLVATAAARSYGEGVAGVLPCFWVYAHMGKVLIERAGHMSEDHPYRAWVQTYDSPEFDESTRQAVRVLEQELQSAPAEQAAAMRAAFEQACVYELHFWASAHALQDWDHAVFAPAVTA
ncbi:thiaminase /4-amino-5-aminomethyl-2-methylpyrimidine deaminase [Brevibacterium sanguinis]|uniref:Thiaminase /4-amino-5-aminomethyl-2-methylpyrimidine deaminase n=2 Tax=Brevibacterium TaxID=1696 RepID=A0A366IPC1_9MICO|nr:MULTISPECIES: TenA family protein [Brevibacterium]RBP68211.1 thiaminase /4-amino-5-aminomethyl-2-methylpyrimidine deaminase [Brevibacterium sanguinis]RBP74372.1 thiaminase /4-amino-5-aminomethyl-2-methylpyrimidine deaminase [Brevibacterium celere]